MVLLNHPSFLYPMTLPWFAKITVMTRKNCLLTVNNQRNLTQFNDVHAQQMPYTKCTTLVQIRLATIVYSQ